MTRNQIFKAKNEQLAHDNGWKIRDKGKLPKKSKKRVEFDPKKHKYIKHPTAKNCFIMVEINDTRT